MSTDLSTAVVENAQSSRVLEVWLDGNHVDGPLPSMRPAWRQDRLYGFGTAAAQQRRHELRCGTVLVFTT